MALLDDNDTSVQQPLCQMDGRKTCKYTGTQFELDDHSTLRPLFVAEIFRCAALRTEEKLSVSEFEIISKVRY